MKRTYLLAASCAALMAAPSFAVCAMADPNTEKAAGKPLVDCWIYPEDGGEGKIVKLKEGAKAPKGYAFQPAPLAEVAAEEAPEVDADALTAENDELKASAKKLAKTAKTVKESNTDKGDGAKAASTDDSDGDGQQ